MNDNSKLMLSGEEQLLVNNAGLILTKRIIIDKVCGLLGEISEKQKLILIAEKHWLPPAVAQTTPKISKGENYLGLPYVILDHPRCFEQEDIFAVRTMFWWGNFFSVSLLLSGTYKTAFQQNIRSNLQHGLADYYIGISQNKWHHHFEADNYIPAKSMSSTEMDYQVLEKSFIKIAVKIPLQHWEQLPTRLEEFFLNTINLMKA